MLTPAPALALIGLLSLPPLPGAQLDCRSFHCLSLARLLSPSTVFQGVLLFLLPSLFLFSHLFTDTPYLFFCCSLPLALYVQGPLEQGLLRPLLAAVLGLPYTNLDCFS
jgi:hypothetical protein